MEFLGPVSIISFSPLISNSRGYSFPSLEAGAEIVKTGNIFAWNFHRVCRLGGFLCCAGQLFTSGFSWTSSCFLLLFFFKWWWVLSKPLHSNPAATLYMVWGNLRTPSAGRCLIEITARPPGLWRWHLQQRPLDRAWSWLQCPQKVDVSVDPAPIGDTLHSHGPPFSLCGEDRLTF